MLVTLRNPPLQKLYIKIKLAWLSQFRAKDVCSLSVFLVRTSGWRFTSLSSAYFLQHLDCSF
jgi:hypothetical protein